MTLVKLPLPLGGNASCSSCGRPHREHIPFWSFTPPNTFSWDGVTYECPAVYHIPNHDQNKNRDRDGEYLNAVLGHNGQAKE